MSVIVAQRLADGAQAFAADRSAFVGLIYFRDCLVAVDVGLVPQSAGAVVEHALPAIVSERGTKKVDSV
jgi:hypothetical protein